MKHSPMCPIFPDILDDKARVWSLTRGPDGRLEEELDLDRLMKANSCHSALEIADALVLAAAIADIEETRAW